MKRILSVIAAAALLLSVTLLFSACGKASEGLEFQSNGDGTCDWVGLGTCEDTAIVVPEKNGEETVVAVGDDVLEHGGKDVIVSVTLPDSVKTIKEGAFQYSDSLETVKFGNGLETIEKHALSDCEKLKSLVLPRGLKKIGGCAFEFSGALTELVIPEGVTEVGDYAFAHMDSLKKLSLPSSLNEVQLRGMSESPIEEIEIKGEMKYARILLDYEKEELSISLCNDKEKMEYSNLYDEINEKELPNLICAALGKPSLKLNGKTVNMVTELEPGSYEKENNLYSFEVKEGNVIVMKDYDGNEKVTLTATVRSSGLTLDLTGESDVGPVTGIMFPFVDSFCVNLEASDGSSMSGWFFKP